MNKLITKCLLSVLFLVNIGCQKEYEEPVIQSSETGITAAYKKTAGSCTEYFYYYSQSKVYLGTVDTTQIIVGLREGITLDQKETFIKNYPFLQSIKNE